MASPKPTTKKSIYPENYILSLENHAIKAIAFSSALLTSSYLIREINNTSGSKIWTINFKPKDVIPLFLLTMTSTYLIDCLQTYNYIPYIFDFRN